MPPRQSETATRTCPCCGARLETERDFLRCSEHGAFFSYGPALIVRRPTSSEALPQALLPWETEQSRTR